ncbi:hypothetical protein ACWFRB_21920 [Rhodococcus sp. NPDC055112]
MADTNPSHDAAARETIAELQAALGSKLVAYLAQVPDGAAVRKWAEGASPLPDHATLDRLRVALDAAQRIIAHDSPAVAQTWFQGRNPALNDRPPAQLLREANLDSVRYTVLAAASEFATNSF